MRLDLLVLGALFCLLSVSSADARPLEYDFTVRFGEGGVRAYDANYLSPLRDKNSNGGTEAFTAVTSPFNTPRTSGTSPHIGTDLKTADCLVDPDCNGIGANVYPVYNSPATYDGKVVDLNASNPNDACGYWVRLRPNLNNNENYDDDQFLVKYCHLDLVTVSVGQRLQYNERVGTSGQTGSASGPHLHFELQSNVYFEEDAATYFVNVNMYPYYRNSSGWWLGHHLDFIKHARYVSPEFRIEVWDYNGTQGLDPYQVVIYYRKHRTPPGGTWCGGVAMTRTGGGIPGAYWYYNLRGQAGGGCFNLGDQVDVLIRAQRYSSCTCYNYAFWKPKFYQPDPNPNIPPQKYAIYVVTVN